MSSQDNRAMNAIFISNISHDINEEPLKALFSEAGQIINFRMIADKASNKFKIAFCEYKDAEMALRAIRSLSGYELKGQTIHVDLATSEKCRQEIEKLQGSIEVVPDVPDPTPDKAPEEISKAVASLPAEQMFELMKQMKMCIENNPQEARNLLLQNPQLAYALLQAQVIMRIVDPTVAIKILSRTSVPDLGAEDKAAPVEASVNEIPQTYPAGMVPEAGDSGSSSTAVSHPDLDSVPSSTPGTGIISGPTSGVMPDAVPGVIPGTVPGVMPASVPGLMPAAIPRLMHGAMSGLMPDAIAGIMPGAISGVMPGAISGVMPGAISGVMPGAVSGIMPGAVSGIMPGVVTGVGVVPSGMPGAQNIPRTSNQFGDQDLRTLGDQDLRTLPNLGDHDMRVLPGLNIDKDMRQPMGDQDFRTLGVPVTASEARPFDPRFRNTQGPERNAIPSFDRPRPSNVDPRIAQDPRNPGGAQRVEDPRKASLVASINSRLSTAGPAAQGLGLNTPQVPLASGAMVPEEQEKAALIMQVLQLTDQQIAALSPDQRQSIMVLKEQLARSQML